MPWLAIPYEDATNRQQLTTLYGIQGIPSLVLLNPDGSVITEDGRGEVNDDSQGTVWSFFTYYIQFNNQSFIRLPILLLLRKI